MSISELLMSPKCADERAIMKSWYTKETVINSVRNYQIDWFIVDVLHPEFFYQAIGHKMDWIYSLESNVRPRQFTFLFEELSK